ncbi:hypothetical protein CGSMWGv0288E_03756 [Gardnerella vaginalis 0288E]|nr:hypothetical protein CGSMWGv0288E_03756 [Gardnerella vaginalis 0288E]
MSRKPQHLVVLMRADHKRQLCSAIVPDFGVFDTNAQHQSAQAGRHATSGKQIIRSSTAEYYKTLQV